MGKRLFFAFAAFILLAIFLLWGFQIFLLDRFYSQTTEAKMLSTAERLSEKYAEGEDALEEALFIASIDNDLCISAFRADGTLIAESDTGGGCLIHRVGDDKLTEFCNKAIEDGGSYFERVSLGAFKGNFRLPLKNGVRDRMLYVQVSQTESGRLVLMLDAPTTPLQTVKYTLILQLCIVSGLLLVVAGITAIWLSHRLSAPIAKVNAAAKRLAKGDFDVRFDGGGYREICELSDTLNFAAKELQSTERMRAELIANISHDLRTPLTMISGYCEMMRDIPGENNPENMQVVLDETARLTGLVNDVIDLSKAQSGAQSLALEEVDLDELLAQTVERYRQLMSGKGYTFVYENVGKAQVVCDRKRITQVVYNLIGNAVNYAGQDQTVIVRLCRGAERTWRVEIEDHGEGIAKEDLPYIFDRYFRVDKVHRRAVTGTGLGLSIVKSILTQHKAAFGVRSELGVGSVFYFEL